MNKFLSFLNSIHLVTEYLMACVFCVIFALYCSGRVGYFLLTVLIFAPFFSILYTFILSKKLKVTLDIPMKIYQKGSQITAEVKLFIPRFLPCPLLKMEIDKTAGIKGENQELSLTKEAFKNNKMMLNLEAELAGGAYIGVSGCRLTDFFNILSFKVKNVDYNRYLVGVLPEIDTSEEIKKKIDLVIKEAYDAKENDESPFEKNTMSDGFPGHEHREYKPGDPLKLINYKLSSKRDEWYVRLLEQQINGKVIIKLDPRAPKHLESEEVAVWWQQEMEQSLGLLYQLLLRQFMVEFQYEKNQCRTYEINHEEKKTEIIWEVVDVMNADYIEVLKSQLAFCVWRDYE